MEPGTMVIWRNRIFDPQVTHWGFLALAAFVADPLPANAAGMPQPEQQQETPDPPQREPPTDPASRTGQHAPGAVTVELGTGVMVGRSLALSPGVPQQPQIIPGVPEKA